MGRCPFSPCLCGVLTRKLTHRNGCSIEVLRRGVDLAYQVAEPPPLATLPRLMPRASVAPPSGEITNLPAVRDTISMIVVAVHSMKSSDFLAHGGLTKCRLCRLCGP